MVQGARGGGGGDDPRGGRGGLGRGAAAAQGAERDPRRLRRGRAVLGGAAREPVRRRARGVTWRGRGVSEEAVVAFRLGVAADGMERPRAGGSRRRDRRRRRSARRGSSSRGRGSGGDYDRFREPADVPHRRHGRAGHRLRRARPRRREGREVHQHARRPRSTRSPKVLYGLDLAREAIRKTRSAVLVEGYFDVIGLHQAGVEERRRGLRDRAHARARGAARALRLPRGHGPLRRRRGRPRRAGQGGARRSSRPGLGRQGGGAPDRATGRSIPTTTPARTAGPGVEALLAAAHAALRVPDRPGGGAGLRAARPREAALEQKLAAVRELYPLRAADAGGARALRLRGRDREAARPRSGGPARGARGERRPAAPAQPPAPPPAGPGPRPGRARPRPPAGRSSRVRLLLPGPAADALGLLAAFPELGPVRRGGGAAAAAAAGAARRAGAGPDPGAARHRGGARAGRRGAPTRRPSGASASWPARAARSRSRRSASSARPP